MKKHRLIIFTILYLLLIISENDGYSQIATDSTGITKEEKTKKGLSWNPFPVIGFNTDIGFQYGILLDLYNYGDGTYYPGYKYSLYAEVSRTTKGSGINQLFFDSKYLLPYGIRITADLSYLTQQALNFYGFNGYEANYNIAYEDDASGNYISRVFYRHQRNFTRFTLDLQGKLYTSNLLWLGGLGYFDTRVSTVNIDKLNKGKDDVDKLPDSTALLYDNYVNWGIIGENEKNGGKIPYLKAGLIYDTRTTEANPMKGIWSEALLFMVPEIFGNRDFSYIKLAIAHRQYFTIIKNKLSFVYRLGYQGTIAGNVPFYMQPYMITSFAKVTTTDGLGGEKTIRGVLRNRVVGDGIAYGNIETRWKFFKTTLWNQNIYLGLNVFADVGTVIQKINVDMNDLDAEAAGSFFPESDESLHWAVGSGFRIVINENFVIAADYGVALDNRDGKDGLYIGIGYLF
jgi:hypothetical protein